MFSSRCLGYTLPSPADQSQALVWNGLFMAGNWSIRPILSGPPFMQIYIYMVLSVEIYIIVNAHCEGAGIFGHHTPRTPPILSSYLVLVSMQ
jgi:hypothetical protein